MALNRPYEHLRDLPAVLPIFPLSGALLLPRGQMPLNIFEPRYLQMFEDALRGHRLIGMVQPNELTASVHDEPAVHAVGCAGRITQFAESGDGRLLITLTGICRFRVSQELTTTTPYRQCAVAFGDFAGDLDARSGEDEVDRESVVRMLRAFSESNRVKLDWNEIEKAPNEALVNALAMMSPFGTVEKQALLEAETLKARAEVLVALAEIEFARSSGTSTVLQ
ncbi:MAG: LON peptidase substrate-binding domain-containing protein [Beijerinckiaceae bacterium]|nr:LON peptidase substrate-binding domain-containing protein [Beijerinckiaceae bacterium]